MVGSYRDAIQILARKAERVKQLMDNAATVSLSERYVLAGKLEVLREVAKDMIEEERIQLDSMAALETPSVFIIEDCPAMDAEFGEI